MDDPEPKREGGRAARRASDTHQRLLQAALTVFNDSGFDGCTIEDITEKADVGKGTFYRHFHDKHAILTALVELAIADIERRLVKPSSSTWSQSDGLANIAHSILSMYRERQDLLLLFMQVNSMMAARKTTLPDLQLPFERYASLVEAQLPSLANHGLNPHDSRLLALSVAGSVLGILMSTLSSVHKESVEGKLNSLCNDVVAGISQHQRGAV